MLYRAVEDERLKRWESTPIHSGWHWHRYYVDEKPIHNVCWVSVTETAVFIHYLGEPAQVIFRHSDEDAYWGPLSPPE